MSHQQESCSWMTPGVAAPYSKATNSNNNHPPDIAIRWSQSFLKRRLTIKVKWGRGVIGLSKVKEERRRKKQCSRLKVKTQRTRSLTNDIIYDDDCCTGPPDRMSHRKWRETKQHLIWSDGSDWLLLSFSPFPVRHPVRWPCSVHVTRAPLERNHQFNSWRTKYCSTHLELLYICRSRPEYPFKGVRLVCTTGIFTFTHTYSYNEWCGR